MLPGFRQTCAIGGLVCALGAHAHYYRIVADATALETLDARDQSFALALGIAWYRNSAWQLESLASLCQAREDIHSIAIRKYLSRVAGAHQGQLDIDRHEWNWIISHDDLAATIESYTQGSFSLRHQDLHPQDLLAFLTNRLSGAPSKERRMPIGVGTQQPVFLSAIGPDPQTPGFAQLTPLFAYSGMSGKSPKFLGLTTMIQMEEGRTVSLAQDPCAKKASLNESYEVRLQWQAYEGFNWHRYGSRIRVFWLAPSQTPKKSVD